jgi:hypothetical protein
MGWTDLLRGAPLQELSTARREPIPAERLGQTELLELAHVALEGVRLAPRLLRQLGGLRLGLLVDERDQRVRPRLSAALSRRSSRAVMPWPFPPPEREVDLAVSDGPELRCTKRASRPIMGRPRAIVRFAPRVGCDRVAARRL